MSDDDRVNITILRPSVDVSLGRNRTSVSIPKGGPEGPPGPQGPQGVPGTGIPGPPSIEIARVFPVEVPDGVRTTFTVPDVGAVMTSLVVTLNGLEELVSVSGDQFIFDEPPLSDDLILCRYQVAS